MISTLFVMAYALAAADVAIPEDALTGSTRIEVIVLARGSVHDRDALVATLAEQGYEITRVYGRFAGFAARALPADIRALARDTRVASIELDRLGHVFTSESAVAIGAAQVRRESGLSGKGVTVAVLDTGVEADHPALVGSVIAQQCFARASCPPDGADSGVLAPEGSGHGTHVSAIISGSGDAGAPGLAPDAALVVIRVFDDQSVGRVSDWVAALDWVAAERERLGIRVVNMSLGTDALWASACDGDQPVMTAAVKLLRQAGVIVFAASGNDANAKGMSAPACISSVVAVGATYDSSFERQPASGTYNSGCFDDAPDASTIVCFSNANQDLDLLAPGARIRAAVPGGFSEKSGTSQATPHASAVAALLLERDPTLSADEIEATLKQTGTPILDVRNGLTFSLISASRAVADVQATWCTRRADFEACPRVDATCDAGVCAGQCVNQRCEIVLPAIGSFPSAEGCEGFIGVASLVAVGVVSRRRRD